MATVQEILDFDISQPAVAYRPSRAAPTPSNASFSRPSKDGTATTWNPKTGKFVTKSADTPRIYGSDQALLATSQRTNFIALSDYHSNTAYVNRASASYVGGVGSGLLDTRTTGYEWSAGGDSSSRIEREGENAFSSGYELVQVIVEDRSGAVVRLKANGTGQNAWFDFDFTSMSIVNQSNGAEINPGFNALTYGGPAYKKPVVQLHLTYNAGQVRGSSTESKEYQIYPDLDGGDDNVVVYYSEMTENATVGAPIITDPNVAETIGGDNITVGTNSTRDSRNITQLLTIKPLFDGKYIDTYAKWGGGQLINHSGGSGANLVNQNSNNNVVSNARVDPFEYNTIAFRYKGEDTAVFVDGVKAERGGNGSHGELRMSFNPFNAGSYLIKGMKSHDRALSDGICQTLTTQ